MVCGTSLPAQAPWQHCPPGEWGLDTEDEWFCKIAARLVICIHKHDESMNPYESAMNQIKKTDESMNPSFLMKKKNATSFLLNSNGFMDSSVL